ncbi:hypothetical protein POM88_018635 [Heracleum sosnowskyi]|uniref:Uncharacterized protein n=1 Tax=Heracleum sosnowskyi TaxID=360622 RepID=A0AAD8IQX4_9APIA|nr:hypothetical protein POM88_018635 [Heracleum sosnowskyi]
MLDAGAGKNRSYHSANWHKKLVGDLDLTYNVPGIKEYIHDGRMQKDVPLLQEVVVLEDTAPLINQERADEVNTHILDFLRNSSCVSSRDLCLIKMVVLHLWYLHRRLVPPF